MRESFKISVVLLCGVVAGCTSSSSNYLGEITKTQESRLFVCHGFDCSYKTRIDLGATDHKQYAAFFAKVASPAAERAAVGKAVRHAEERASGVIGVRDLPKSDYTQSRVKGQMDCIDESTNTRSLLLYLEKRGLLKETLVVLTTEFGRTPNINQNGGRDHYPKAFSSVLWGGGVAGGLSYGKTDKGIAVTQDAVAVPDLTATIAYALGLPLDTVLFSPTKRPFTIADKGKPLTQIFG